MFSWPDVVSTLGIVLLAIVGGYLKVLPEKLVAALVMAAVGYFAARTALKAKKDRDEKQQRELGDGGADDGVPQVLDPDADSGIVEIAPQLSGRVVKVRPNGSVFIGPPEERAPFSEPDGDRTPVERNRNLPLPTDEEKVS